MKALSCSYAVLLISAAASSQPGSHWQPGLVVPITLKLLTYICLDPIRKNIKLQFKPLSQEATAILLQ